MLKRFWPLMLLPFTVNAAVVHEGTNVVVDSVAFDNGSPLTMTSWAMPAGTEAIVAFTGLRANMASADLSVNWDSAGTPEALTAVHDVNDSSSSSADVQLDVWCLISPTVQTANLELSTTSGTGDNAWLVVIAYSGIDTTSCANLVSELAEDIDNAAASNTAVFASAGTAGDAGLVVCTGVGADTTPASNNQTWTERHDTDTGGGAGGASDQGIYVAENLDPFPSAITVTLGATDEHSCGYYSITAAAGSVNLISGLFGKKVKGKMQ